jgi:chromosomal replication initiation ATPase DnaA
MQLHIAVNIPAGNYPLPLCNPRGLGIPIFSTRNWLERRSSVFWRWRFDLIMRAVCAAHQVSPEAVLSPRRTKEIVHARHHVAHDLRKQLGWSLPRIARALNLKDHTSVIWAIEAHERRTAMQTPRLAA